MYSGRRAERRLVSQPAAIFDHAGNRIVECTVRDVSATGAQLELREDLALPKSFLLALTQTGGVRRSCETVWQLSIVAGVWVSHLPNATPITPSTNKKRFSGATPGTWRRDTGTTQYSDTPDNL